jgi:hypothetical protein
MNNKAVVIGIFIMAGIIVGAAIVSFANHDRPPETNPAPVSATVDALALRIDSLEDKIAEIDLKLQDYLLTLEANNRKLKDLKDQLAAAGENTGSPGGGPVPADSSGGLRIDKQEIIETLKDEVKREIKEETEIAKRDKQAAGVKEWADSQTQGLRKRMDEQFLQFAEKIKLDRNQEIAVREITEQLIDQISTIWSDWETRLSEGMTDQNWGEFKGELGQAYDTAAEQLLQHVSERQAKNIMEFIQSPGGK